MLVCVSDIEEVVVRLRDELFGIEEQGVHRADEAGAFRG